MLQALIHPLDGAAGKPGELRHADRPRQIRDLSDGVAEPQALERLLQLRRDVRWSCGDDGFLDGYVRHANQVLVASAIEAPSHTGAERQASM